MSLMARPPRSSSAADSSLNRLGDFYVPVQRFDPADHVAQLARLLDQGFQTERFSVRPVGLNHTVWILSCQGRHEGWMLKQVAAHRRFSGLPTDTECCDALISKFPGIPSDPKLAFPHSVLHLKAQSGEHVGDLLVARQAPGVQLGRFLADLDLAKPEDQQRLQHVSSGVGELLADFHTRYADPITGEVSHHTDFHPSNVLFHEPSGTLSIVDLTGMGSGGIRDDVDKFARLIGHLAGDRYAAAFRLRYISLWKGSDFTSSVSTAASSTDLGLLYSQSSSDNSSRTPRRRSFQYLSSLVMPKAGFHPSQSLTSLAWLLSPERKVVNPKVTELSSGSVWMLSESNQKECWILEKVSSSKPQSESQSVAGSCEEVARRFPALLADERAAFPQCAIPLQVDQHHSFDLLVSRAVCGIELDRYVAELDLDRKKDREKLRCILHKVGETLGDFHVKYVDLGTGEALQHGDFQLRSVLYNEATEGLCFCNMTKMGSGSQSDLQTFHDEVKRLGNCYAEAFRQGYPGSCQRTVHGRVSHGIGLFGPWNCAGEASDSGSEIAESEVFSDVASEPDDQAANHDEGCSLM
ncbi:unnamed protein product [Polarella glacialis]|uniref:Uncharacterized protein n=1 Tax=Polarella glacialis TaxID=89957 RepID=A0A813LMQ9_POLGL|nr:unnamed protein product [Polarella glacialis]